MSQVKYKSAGVSAKSAGLTGTTPTVSPTVPPALVIGTSRKGPAFVPISFSSVKDFNERFGDAYVSGSVITPYDRLTSYGPLAVEEWLRNSTSVTFMRVLGTGDGKKRVSSGVNTGDVTGAGFTVGEQQPDHSNSLGMLSSNPYANSGGVPGRTYFLGCFMSESAGSTIFNSAGLQGTGSVNGIGGSTSVPVIRGILMAPSGVVLRLSSSGGGIDSSSPSSTLVASDTTSKGTTLGSVQLFDSSNGKQLQQFVMLLNGHKGSGDYPNVITASFDIQSPLYITKVFNLTASLMQIAGHYLDANWDIHPVTAILTGTGVVSSGADVPSDSQREYSTERSVFLITSSLSRDVGSSTVPNYESFRDRFSYAVSPWIISQRFHGKPINLFRLHALDAGSEVSRRYKFVISNITPAEVSGDNDYRYGTFDISIRNSDDFEEIMPPLERYLGVSLDPSSETYISKIIGDRNDFFDFDRPESDQRLVVEGNYPNLSRYVRVEVSDDVENKSTPPESLPLGFRGMAHIVTSGSMPLAPLGGSDAASLLNSNFLRNSIVPPVPFTNNIVVNSGNSAKIPSNVRRWGIKLDHIDDLSEQNKGFFLNDSIRSFVKHYPNHSVNNVNFSVSNNEGASDTTQLGIIDADRFCNNLFTLENVKVLTDINDKIPQKNWIHASYVRNGSIENNVSENTRRLQISDFTNANSAYLSFQFMLQGGFDGVNIFETNEFNISNTSCVADMIDPQRGKLQGPSVSSYLTALKIASETSAIDMQILTVPGIREPAVTDRAAEVVETRIDSLYVMDIEQVDENDNLMDISRTLAYTTSSLPSIEKTLNRFTTRSVNSSYVASYFPDVALQLDYQKHRLEYVEVPPSVVVLGAMSLNDSLGQPWFAPAGVSRGALTTTLSTTVKLKEPDLDSLYSNGLNPLWTPQSVSGEGSGVVIWGQKTLANQTSLFSRISVRRLLLEIRRQARDVATRLLFESNRNNVISRFNTEMSGRLSRIRSLLGVESYRINVDVSTSTQSDVDNGTLRGKIYIVPKDTTQFVSVDFIVSNKPGNQ